MSNEMLELIDDCLNRCDTSSELHKDLFINNVRCLINLWKGRQFTLDKYKAYKDKAYYDAIKGP